MFRWILFLVAGGLLAVSSLTVVKAPGYTTWKLAIIAGEFGHWLALAALACAATVLVHAVVYSDGDRRAAGRNRRVGVSIAAGVLALAATGLFFRPLLVAWRIGRELPYHLTAAFGDRADAGGADRALEVRRLYRGERVEPVAMRTITITPEGTAAPLAMDFYPAQTSAERPEGDADNGSAPCVIMIHGGGWDGGGRDVLPELNHRLARRGVAVAAISYRLAPEHPWPAQRDDVLAAVTYIKAHAAELGVDAGKLVLFGRSAGGQIATAVGYSANDPAIRAVVALYAPHDLEYVWSIGREDDVLNSPKLLRQFLGGPPDTPERVELYRTASAQFLVSPGRTPPTLLVHGALDELVWVKHSERLAARLTEADVPHHFLRLPWATHAADYNPDGPSGQLIAFSLAWLLDTITREP